MSHAGAWWLRLTALGDSAVLLPIALLLAAWLLVQPATRRAGLRWTLVLGACIAGIVTTKLAYMGWGIHPPGINFVGMSGHSAMSFLVWPVIAALLAGRAGPRGRAFAIAAGVLLALGVSVSRLAVDAHTPPEVVVGSLWGALASAVFLAMERRPPPIARLGGWAALGLLLPLVLTYGHVFPSNRILAQVARTISGHSRIYTRCDLPRRVRGDTCVPARQRAAPASVR